MISFFKYIGLAFIAASFVSGTVVFAMQSSDEEESSPRSQTAVAGPSTPSAASSSTEPVEQTPGQKIAQKQAEFLDREKFRQVIGAEIVDSWPVDWGAFTRDPHTPHTSEKFSNFHSLMSKLRPLFRKRSDEAFTRLFQDMLLIRAQIEDVHLDRLEGVVKRYFEERFPDSEVTFKVKGTGVQLGTIVKVKEQGGDIHTFYGKTHSDGKLASKSSAAKIVDPHELFVYKVLEALGLGCETHFCARSPEDVYIATRDAAEGGHFFLFQQATQEEEGVGGPLWGRLGHLSKSPRENKNNEEAIEDDLAHDSTAQNFAHQLVTADVLARLLGLHDLLNNPDNFGFFQSADSEFPALRVLDFRLDVKSVEFIDPIFYGLLSGNGTFHYAAAHKTLGWLLHERNRAKRVATALHILTSGSLQTLEEAIEDAYRNVCDFIQETPAFEAYREKFIQELTSYRESLQQNRRRLIDLLSAWKPEEPSAASASSVAAAVDAGGAL